MSSSFLEDKINDLQARLKAETENETPERTNTPKDLGISALASPRQGSGRRPKQLGDMGTPTRTRKQLVDLPVSVTMQPPPTDCAEVDRKMKEIMKMNGLLTINGRMYKTEVKHMENLGDLGSGTCGHVVKMLHKPSQTVIAVKQMRRSGNCEENKRIMMDLDVVLKSHDCPYIVRCLGCLITESDVWICMELMATCFDRLLKRLRRPIPEHILGKIAFATVKALNYLKESHGVIHRDVKPSNILLDERGNVKLCDFGISGRLVDSKAKTKNAGCAAYMAPERIEPPDPRKPDYDIRADVWSLGITLVELATGVFPYKDCKCDFEVLSRVLNDDPPSLPPDPGRFSPEFQRFVSSCLTKNFRERPKYNKLLEHPFLKRYETAPVDVSDWYAQAIRSSNSNNATNSSNAILLNNCTISATTVRRLETPPSPAPMRRHPPPPPPVSNSFQRVFDSEKYSSEIEKQSNSPLRPSENSSFTNGLSSTEWDNNKFSISTYSPAGARKRYPYDIGPMTHTHQSLYTQHRITTSQQSSITSHNSLSNQQSTLLKPQPAQNLSGSTSPLVLQRFYHQQQQQQHSFRSSSVSPSRRFGPEPTNSIEESTPNNGKKRFASYLKFHLGGGSKEDSRLFPPLRSSRQPSPAPCPTPPSPPPRLNRQFSNPLDKNPSPLLLRRGYFDSPPSPAPVRRFGEGSPSLSRRYVTPTPPIPPPRRISECNSVPTSPQCLQARFHYTPEPQRRIICDFNNV
ncbi:unnamed protein product [Bemisia tabaci]|uniref:mitogen-activated protein kinase kinase n=1 Tax=Bemisia tabaci TaxID=7038 RepID=A0A9P0A7T6_BEMTA|nr:unnamed protein product [Bemisia tabaci]